MVIRVFSLTVKNQASGSKSHVELPRIRDSTRGDSLLRNRTPNRSASYLLGNIVGSNYYNRFKSQPNPHKNDSEMIHSAAPTPLLGRKPLIPIDRPPPNYTKNDPEPSYPTPMCTLDQISCTTDSMSGDKRIRNRAPNRSEIFLSLSKFWLSSIFTRSIQTQSNSHKPFWNDAFFRNSVPRLIHKIIIVHSMVTRVFSLTLKIKPAAPVSKSSCTFSMVR